MKLKLRYAVVIYTFSQNNNLVAEKKSDYIIPAA